MTLLERDEMMREEGRTEERVNTLLEKERADKAEQRAVHAEQHAQELELEITALKDKLSSHMDGMS